MIKLIAILWILADAASFSREVVSLHSPSLHGQYKRHLGIEVRSIQSDEKGDGTDVEGVKEDQRSISNKNFTKLLVRRAFEVGETVSTLFFTTAGVFFAIGLFLNLNGYGYQFSLSEGIRIDTLDEMRLERQLERDSVKRTVSENARSTPASQLMQFFYKQPFTASLILTSVALAYEEVVKVPQARKQEEDEIP